MQRVDDARIAVVGLGYVGLPLAVEFGRQLPVVGFDINQRRVAELRAGRDHTLEVSEAELAAAMVGFGLVASMATLPLWHWLLAG